MTTSTQDARATSVSALQGEAWAAWNRSYHHDEDRELFRALGQALYEIDVHERIAALFARSDAQNAALDGMNRAA